MRLPRRYRMLLQVDKLTRCMANKKAKYSSALKNKIKRVRTLRSNVCRVLLSMLR